MMPHLSPNAIEYPIALVSLLTLITLITVLFDSKPPHNFCSVFHIQDIVQSFLYLTLLIFVDGMQTHYPDNQHSYL